MCVANVFGNYQAHLLKKQNRDTIYAFINTEPGITHMNVIHVEQNLLEMKRYS